MVLLVLGRVRVAVHCTSTSPSKSLLSHRVFADVELDSIYIDWNAVRRPSRPSCFLFEFILIVLTAVVIEQRSSSKALIGIVFMFMFMFVVLEEKRILHIWRTVMRLSGGM